MQPRFFFVRPLWAIVRAMRRHATHPRPATDLPPPGPGLGRRGALLTFLAAVGSIASCCTRGRGSSKRSGAGHLRPPSDGLSVTRELARLEARDYAEEGIPMFLACENLAGPGASRSSVGASGSDVGIAAEFRDLTTTLSRSRPEVRESEVAKIVELLAERDLVAGGKEGHR